MEWNALDLSLKLAFWTCASLLPLAVMVGRWLAWNHFRGKAVVEALVAVTLVLPPTVLGYYLILSFGSTTTTGRVYETLTGHGLVFTFDGLLLASIIFNLPFAVQPMQRAFEAVPMNVREAAWCCGMSHWQTFWRIELPLAWTGILSALVLTFAHTLGEFGVVLMMGGNIPVGRVVVFDDDHYYMGGVMAELLVNKGASVTLVTPAAYVSEWTNNTLEQKTIHRRLVEFGVEIVLNRAVTQITKGLVATSCVFSGQQQSFEADAVLMVTSRTGNDELWNDLLVREE